MYRKQERQEEKCCVYVAYISSDACAVTVWNPLFVISILAKHSIRTLTVSIAISVTFLVVCIGQNKSTSMKLLAAFIRGNNTQLVNKEDLLLVLTMSHLCSFTSIDKEWLCRLKTEIGRDALQIVSRAPC